MFSADLMFPQRDPRFAVGPFCHCKESYRHLPGDVV